MNKIFKIGLIGVFSLFFSCNGNISLPIEEGIYFGTFAVEHYDSYAPTDWSSKGTVTLELKNGRYTYNSDIPPKLCSGNYSIINDKIVFDREGGTEGVSPYFDICLRLDGEYDYTFNGKRLKFSAIRHCNGNYENDINYKYDLKKQ